MNISFYLYFFFLLIIISGIFVIFSKNPIQSILFLIIVFLFSIIIFISIGAEFVALLILIVYVGAINVLFLFVIMLLNLRVVEVHSGFFYYLPIGGFIAFFFFFSLLLFIFSDFNKFYVNLELNTISYYNLINVYQNKANLVLIGELFFNYFTFYLFMAGLILFVAIVGSITLTLNYKDFYFF